ncbi:MAG TPA: DUF4279 domain-containing protein [Chryseolinea sp.]
MDIATLNWIKGLAINEVLKKRLSLTKQFLEENDVLLEKGIPQIARVDCDKEDAVVVYFPVEDKEYFFGVTVKLGVEPYVNSVAVEAGNSVVLTVTSENLQLAELLAYCKFDPTEKWGIGETTFFRNSPSKNSGFIYDPIVERADECSDNMEKLLTELEKYKDDILELSRNASPLIQVYWYGNAKWMSSLELDRSLLKRISNLNLTLDFDLNVD